jgi:hypothetical protein
VGYHGDTGRLAGRGAPESSDEKFPSCVSPFADALNKRTSDALFWAVTIVNCPREMPNVRLAIGSNAASVWWVNGKEVIGIYGDRQTVIDDGVSKRIALKKGPNVVRAAIVNGGGATGFCARFLDADDKPLKGFTVSVVDATK